jgi:hypothetical protein
LNLQEVEARFQRYRGKVRLLYTYVREAHPNPARAPCGSTEDLGWEHASGNTRSRAERAQRARWLGKDRNLSFPWIIDDINDTMFWELWPYGFYVDWLIDCDWKVLLHEPWGWATTHTQWCDLPLADFDDLDAFLEAYLASPPPCYRGVVDAPRVSVVPVAAHSRGAAGSRWVTDLSVANPGDDEAHVTIHVHRWQADKSDPEPRQWSLPARQSLELDDVLASAFAIDGAATLRVESDRPVVTVSRTYNDTPDGTYGQFVRALPLGHAIGDEVAGHLLMLEESPRFRTNVGVTSLSDHEVSVEVEIVAANGASLGATVLTLPPRGAIQRFRMIRDFTKSAVEGARATVRVLTPDGRVMAYATVIDNRTGDPTYIEPIVNTFQADMRMPGAAKIRGANDSRWVTDMVVSNLEDVEVTATVELFERDTSGGGADGTVDLALAPGQSLLILDVLTTLFSSEGAAAIAIHGSRGLAAVGRTYNDTPSGTFGQFVPGLDISADGALRRGTVGHLLQLEESGAEGRRTNLGLVNTGRVPTAVELRFFDEHGLLLGVIEEQLSPFGNIQLNRVLRSVTDSALRNARAEVRVESGIARVIAYAASVDNRSGDPVMQLAWPVEEELLAISR